MTYPIHDWRDASKYPQDPLTGAPAAFIEERLECGQSEEEIRSALWHWQFLRRHKLYQDHWENDGDEYFDTFGVGGVPRPDPKADFPMDLLFKYELFKKRLRYPATIDLQKSLEENVIYLKQRYNLLKALTSPLDLAMASVHDPREELTGGRKRQLAKEKYPNLLRVLDALAAGEKLTQIARVLNPKAHDETLYTAASRRRESAFDLQSALTQLPRMGERII